jgi:hypothetical protein
MKHIFDRARQNAKRAISEAKNDELFSDQFEENIFNENKIVTPYLDKDNTSQKIDNEVVGVDNPPPSGVSFTPGEKLEFALFSVPIKGDIELFLEIIKGIFWDNQKFISGKTLYYKEISKKPITNNDEVIDSIRKNAQDFINGVQRDLEQFNNKAEQFNENDLRPTIENEISEERKKRNDRGSSEDKLKPF